MAIKGGLLDCKGQLENEENFNRIQERYGYEDSGEVPVVWKDGKEWGGTVTIEANDVGNYFALEYCNSDYEYGVLGLKDGDTVYVNDEAFIARNETNHAQDSIYAFLGEKYTISHSPIAEGTTRLLFASPITEGMVGQTYTLRATRRETVTYPMDSKYLPAAEAVADAAGDTVTGEELNALLASLRNAGYLSK